MRRLLKTIALSTTLCTGFSSAISAEDSTPAIMEMTVRDLAATAKRFEQSLYGKALMIEQTTEARAVAQAAISQLLFQVGMNSLDELLAATRGAELVLHPPQEGQREPNITIQIRGDALHQTIIDLFTRGREAEAIDGAGLDSAFRVRRNQFYGTKGDALVLANTAEALKQPTIAGADGDIFMRWNGPAFAALMEREFPRELRPFAGLLIPSGSASYAFTERGLR